MSASKGRTLWEILTGRNKRNMTPLELQYHNPLGAKIGNTISFDHEEDLKGINFVIERIVVYETLINDGVKIRKFYHTDYCLKGISLDMDKPLRVRLRLLPDEDATNTLGCKLQILHLYHEEGFNQTLYDYLNNPVVYDKEGKAVDKAFCVNQDDAGNELAEPRMYWRVNDVEGPYKAKATTLRDEDGNGRIDDNELTHNKVEYWDFSRLTKNDQQVEFLEYLWAEMDETSRYISMMRGTEILASQVMVI